MDIELHYTEYGSGEPLILLHGNGESSEYFEPQIEMLASAFRVIAVDTRGHGQSPRGTAPFTLNQFVLDLHHLLNKLEISSAHLYGFSDGGNIALLFALSYPNMVYSLVLNGANLFPEGLEDEVRAQDALDYEKAVKCADIRSIELLKLMMDEPQINPDDLRGITVPTLIIAGTEDMISSSHTQLIHECIAGSKLVFIEGDHFVSAGNPLAFNKAVSRFYGDLGFKLWKQDSPVPAN